MERRTHNQRWRDCHHASLMLGLELEEPLLGDVERFIYLAAQRLLESRRRRSLAIDDATKPQSERLPLEGSDWPERIPGAPAS
jgi:hypothetical protein